MTLVPASCRRAALASCLVLSSLVGCATEYEGIDLMPLYRDVGDEKAGEFFWLIPPYWSSWDENETLSWSIPFHLHKTTGEHSELTYVPILPLWYHNRSPQVESTALVPLWQRDREGVRSKTKLLLFVASWTSDDDAEGLRAFALAPLFGWREGAQGDAWDFVTTNDLVTGKSGAGALVSLMAIDRTKPSFGTTDEPGIEFDFVNLVGGLVQLFHHDTTGSHDETRLLTLFASEPLALFRRRTPHEGGYGDGDSVTMFFPFYWNYRWNAKDRLFAVWPFYGFSEKDEIVTERYVLWPLLTTYHDDAGKRHGFEALLGLFGSGDEGGIDETWLWPLFDVKSNERGHDWSVLLGLFGHARNETRSVTRVLWIPFESEPESESEDSAVVAPSEVEPPK